MCVCMHVCACVCVSVCVSVCVCVCFDTCLHVGEVVLSLSLSLSHTHTHTHSKVRDKNTHLTYTKKVSWPTRGVHVCVCKCVCVCVSWPTQRGVPLHKCRARHRTHSKPRDAHTEKHLGVRRLKLKENEKEKKIELPKAQACLKPQV